MAGTGREAVSTALFVLLQTVANFQTAGRRFLRYDAIGSCQKPALFLTEPHETITRAEFQHPAIRELMYDCYIFIDTGTDPNATPITDLNNIIDAIDPAEAGVLKPEYMTNRQTLGNLVWDCYIEGKVEKVPGDIDGQGVAIIPIKVIMAS